jgi:UDP-glucose 4-epimerase
MRTIVTGGAGFIGSHLVDALLAAGDQVTVVDHLKGGHSDNLAQAFTRGAVLVRGDVTDVEAMSAAVREARPEVIYHLAGQIDVRVSVRDPAFDAHVNVGGTASMLEAARRAGVGRVVFASTAAVYGNGAKRPTPESAPIAPISPYGAGKAAAETYMELFERLHGMSTMSLRMSNVYGARQNPNGESGVVAILCGAQAEGRSATVFGDGMQTRDYVYVGDVVAAFMAAGRSRLGGALNVSSGAETTLRELVGIIGVDTVSAPARQGEVRRSCLDPSRAAARLRWRAATPLDAGVTHTLAAMAALTGT